MNTEFMIELIKNVFRIITLVGIFSFGIWLWYRAIKFLITNITDE